MSFDPRLFVVLALILFANMFAARGAERPNILIAISDDQSYPHASVYGAKELATPAFDRVAREGVLFSNAYCGSPGCSPSRAVFLAGRHHWSLGHAGTHASSFPIEHVTLPDLLESAGYAVGYTGKGWGPGNFKIDGRERNPAGPSFSSAKLDEAPAKGISRNDYAKNFELFLKTKEDDQPFYFWYGATEPHRSYEAGRGTRLGKSVEDVQVPSFLPDVPEIRSDLLDYYTEIEHFDTHLNRMLETLKANNMLENTLVIVTSDNGMPFPRAKANCYDSGVHVPLAISWPAEISGRQVCNDNVGFVDLHQTILAAAGVNQANDKPGRDLLEGRVAGELAAAPVNKYATFFGRERHSSSRWNNLGYPQRGIRVGDFLLVWNLRPDRWPAGAPQKFNGEKLGPQHGGYHDIDACPTLTWMIQERDSDRDKRYFDWAVQKRPEFELFNVVQDPDCIDDLASSPEHQEVRASLLKRLKSEMQATKDPRAGEDGDIFETYRRYSPIRTFPEPK